MPIEASTAIRDLRVHTIAMHHIVNQKDAKSIGNLDFFSLIFRPFSISSTGTHRQYLERRVIPILCISVCFKNITQYLYFCIFSELFNFEREFQSLLGGITYDDNGKILSAKAIELKIIGKQNGTAAKLNHINSQNAIGEYVSQTILIYHPFSLSIVMTVKNFIPLTKFRANFFMGFSKLNHIF